MSTTKHFSHEVAKGYKPGVDEGEIVFPIGFLSFLANDHARSLDVAINHREGFDSSACCQSTTFILYESGKQPHICQGPCPQSSPVLSFIPVISSTCSLRNSMGTWPVGAGEMERFLEITVPFEGCNGSPLPSLL